ncbi:MAG TPA: MFS transporter [bacterium]|nr:MFS transporter [Myxococcales bacterium]OQA61421.1 MAG: Regulatory protein UhpC [bacterium ADurb.Bin270]HPW45632.1 MFS transporter [bacterium]HQG12888.1 MFS transporter [bacterium]
MASLISLIKPAPYIPQIEDPEERKRLYKHFRTRNLYGMVVGYAIYYFVRKNFSMAMPVMLQELGYTKTDFGAILTLFAILYGIGKFVNGVLGDYTNARYLMAFGLLLSGVINFFFGMSSGIMAFGFFWLLNAWVQSLGMPASVRLLTRWFSPTELGTIWGIQSTAHQIGGAGIMVFAGWLIPRYGWRFSFYIPAAIAILTSFWLINRLRDTPQSVGLPPIEKHRGETTEADPDAGDTKPFMVIMKDHIFRNRLLWIVATANIFVYVVRVGIMDWAPTFLTEARGSGLVGAGFKTAAFELAGMLGAIGAGWVSDKIFRGRRGPLATISMILLGVVVSLLWILPPGRPMIDTALLIAAGILVYGPQLLVPVAATDFACKQAASTAAGVTGAFGYIGAAISGLGTGLLVDKYGWAGGIYFFAGAAFLGSILFAMTWNKRSPHIKKIK